VTRIEKYTRPAIVLHWLIAVLIGVNIALGLLAESLPDDWIRTAIDSHKSIGLTVLGLLALRILWRVTHAPPPLPRYAGWEKTASQLTHFALYGVIVGLPLTGWMHDSAFKAAAEHPLTLFGLVEVPRIGWIMSIAQPDKEQLHGLFFGAVASVELEGWHLAGDAHRLAPGRQRARGVALRHDDAVGYRRTQRRKAQHRAGPAEGRCAAGTATQRARSADGPEQTAQGQPHATAQPKPALWVGDVVDAGVGGAVAVLHCAEIFGHGFKRQGGAKRESSLILGAGAGTQ